VWTVSLGRQERDLHANNDYDGCTDDDSGSDDYHRSVYHNVSGVYDHVAGNYDHSGSDDYCGTYDDDH
jgi:hypothetical protein